MRQTDRQADEERKKKERKKEEGRKKVQTDGQMRSEKGSQRLACVCMQVCQEWGYHILFHRILKAFKKKVRDINGETRSRGKVFWSRTSEV